jgi:hypothetical protein
MTYCAAQVPKHWDLWLVILERGRVLHASQEAAQEHRNIEIERTKKEVNVQTALITITPRALCRVSKRAIGGLVSKHQIGILHHETIASNPNQAQQQRVVMPPSFSYNNPVGSVAFHLLRPKTPYAPL